MRGGRPEGCGGGSGGGSSGGEGSSGSGGGGGARRRQQRLLVVVLLVTIDGDGGVCAVSSNARWLRHAFDLSFLFLARTATNHSYGFHHTRTPTPHTHPAFSFLLCLLASPTSPPPSSPLA